ncbi:MAG: hypothetical protein H7Y04_15915 [Verrucomicrobia bacterium]|nr:hypothetical protein [Cytophagales bacterium]
MAKVNDRLFEAVLQGLEYLEKYQSDTCFDFGNLKAKLARQRQAVLQKQEEFIAAHKSFEQEFEQVRILILKQQRNFKIHRK